MALLNSARLGELYELGGHAFVREIWQVFLETTAHDLPLLQKSLILGDLSQVAQIAHRLKSASGNVGAERMQGCCYTLELAANAGNDELTLMNLCSEIVISYHETARLEPTKNVA